MSLSLKFTLKLFAVHMAHRNSKKNSWISGLGRWTSLAGSADNGSRVHDLLIIADNRPGQL
jgi:hypothetical protein